MTGWRPLMPKPNGLILLCLGPPLACSKAYSYMCFEALELWLLQRFPGATWMQSHHSSSRAGASGRAVIVPSRALLLLER